MYLLPVSIVMVMILNDVLRVKNTQASVLGLPASNKILKVSDDYSLPVLKGLRLQNDNSLEIEFIVDTQDKRKINKSEADLLIKYFLAALAMPEDQLWVNLSSI